MKPIFNRAPLTPGTLAPLPLGSIKPGGWLLEELTLQAKGITADFEAACPEFSGDEWRPGADGDLTRAVYYLEGLIALGWTLDDEYMKSRARERVEWILRSQRDDGWFGPADNDDYWPLMLALRALRLFFTATGDKRVLVLMNRFFRYQYRNLATRPLREWAVARGGENMELALWLYNITGQKYLLELCQRLRAQTLDWPTIFHTFPNVRPMNKSVSWTRLCEALGDERDEPFSGDKRPYFHSQYHQTEGVNVAMGLKCPGVINLFKSGFKEQGGFHYGYEKLMKYHGMASGMFSCDRHLDGSNPTQGASLQAVVELMNTLEALTGMGDFGAEPADALEKLAYNALPAAFTPDMKRYQNVQQANQVEISPGARNFYNAGEDANLFHAARNDLDCASCHQAWAKFTSSLWYATDDGGLWAASYAPCTLRATLYGVPVRLRVTGGYPFEGRIQIQLWAKQPVEFPLYLRIPFWARQAMIYLPDGEIMQVRAGEAACVRRRWISGDVVRLELPAAPRLTRWYHQSGAVEVGPVLMALRVQPQWSEADGALEARPVEVWNRALVRDEPMKLIQVEEDISAFGQGEPALSVLVRGAEIEWRADGGNCAPIPMAPKLEKEELDILELVPYGEAPLRICEFPLGIVRAQTQKEIM